MFACANNICSTSSSHFNTPTSATTQDRIPSTMIPKDKPVITATNEEIRHIQDKARQRQALREYIIKERSNPFRAAASKGLGFIEDPAFIRYEAAQTFMSEFTHFKITMKTTGFFLGCIVGPMVAIGLYSTWRRSQFEDMCRRGEIAYKDRNNKFVIM